MARVKSAETMDAEIAKLKDSLFKAKIKYELISTQLKDLENKKRKQELDKLLNAFNSSGKTLDEYLEFLIQRQKVMSSKFVFKNEDCLITMAGMENESIDLVLTSPPYGIGKPYENKMDIDEYFASMKPIADEICRVSKKTGSVCIQVGSYVKNTQVVPLDIGWYKLIVDNGMVLRNRIIWHYKSGLQSRRRFSGLYETVLWFTWPVKNYIFNLDAVKIPAEYYNKKKWKGPSMGQLTSSGGMKNPGDVWEIKRVSNNSSEKLVHPCQTPEELADRLILALSDEGQVVYDPFSGVASILASAVKHNRIAYGSEIGDWYYLQGLWRLNHL